MKSDLYSLYKAYIASIKQRVWCKKVMCFRDGRKNMNKKEKKKIIIRPGHFSPFYFQSKSKFFLTTVYFFKQTLLLNHGK